MRLSQLFYKTDTGKVRPHNEDAVNIFKNDNCAIMVVADGMGGHEAGDIASKMVIQKVEQYFHPDLEFREIESARRWIKEILNQINQEILLYIEQQGISHGMGTTVIITVITETFIAFSHIGDSRAYILAYNELRQITKDHTFVRKLVEEGQLSEKAAKSHPHRNIIMNALGVSKSLKFDYLLLENYELNAILLCTDGLTSMLDEKDILPVLNEKIETEEKVKKLIELANENGGNDNISVALCEFGERSDTL